MLELVAFTGHVLIVWIEVIMVVGGDSDGE